MGKVINSGTDCVLRPICLGAVIVFVRLVQSRYTCCGLRVTKGKRSLILQGAKHRALAEGNGLRGCVFAKNYALNRCNQIF